MIKAFVLGKINPNSEKKVMSSVQKIRGVKSVDITFGQYDMVACVEVNDEMELKSIVFDVIRKNPDVLKTLTLVAQKI